MGYSNEVIKAANDIVRERRLSAEYAAELRREKIFEELPQAKDFEQAIASCGINAGRAVLKGGDVKLELERLKEQSLALQSDFEKLLNTKGYTIKDMEPKYFCEKCGDTGKIEYETRTDVCDCLKRAMIEAACAELNSHSKLSLCTFDDFSLDYYSMDIEGDYPRSAYEQMSNILKYCKDYAKNFSLKSENIFMRGLTGLGKTHLSLSIANEVIKKGYGVVYISAPKLLAQLEKEQFSRNKPETSVLDTIEECDLLIIDDLGTEFSNQFSSQAVYNVFNTRLLTGKPLIVNTNLSLKELENLYTQRFVSRISGEAKRLDFFGRDIRIMKK
ncbi:MAG: ATP-binding protein [Ruminococcus sp.]|nr:ATP-binding protein [Ruminococcus sp.]